MLDVVQLDYIRTARSKGLAERITLVKHVVRNALIPVVTLLAIQVPQIFTGALVTEQIFRVPGIGSLLISAILSNDTPVVMAITFVFSVAGRDVRPAGRPALRLAGSPDLLPLRAATMAGNGATSEVVVAGHPAGADAPGRLPVARGDPPVPASPARHGRDVSSSLAMVIGVVVGPFVYRVPIDEIDFRAKLKAPSAAHPLGTDDLGQDILARILYGGRISLAVGVVAMLIAIGVGTTIGAIAGQVGGRGGQRADARDRPVPVAARSSRSSSWWSTCSGTR